MTRLEQELGRRLTLLERTEAKPPPSRLLPRADTIALAAITFGSFAVVLIAQAL